MIATLQTPPTTKPAPLTAGNFRRVAQGGFGDGCNSYAYSSVWFDGRLYIGTVRNVLPVVMLRWPFKIPFVTPPVPMVSAVSELDLRGQIWRYDPVGGGDWERVFRSPLVEGLNGQPAPLAVGFRCMTIYQGVNDPKPAIYTFPVVGGNAKSAVTLRSYNGTEFEQLPPPDVPGAGSEFGSFRAVVSFKGKLFVAPSHARAIADSDKTQVNVAPVVGVLCTEDPASGVWQISSPPSFDDPTNVVVFDMAASGGYLYASVGNIRKGFQLWRTAGEGPAPHDWELVLDRGADRGQLNQAVISFAEFDGALYLGTGIQNGGFDRTNNVGPAAAEVLRVWPDKTWDLVVGEPRQSRQGLKIPLSGMNAGFDNPLGTYMWRMAVHDGTLYVGTHDLSTFSIYADPATWPPHLKRLHDPRLFEQFLRRRGGCDLWRTTNGERWSPVTQNGFDCPYNYGIRVLQSTPHGLFVGTANPFGPEVAVRSADGWRHVENPRGGLEVHWGRADHTAGPTGDKAECARRDVPTGALGETLADLIGSPLPVAFDPGFPDPDSHGDPLANLADGDKDLGSLGWSVDDEVNAYFTGGPRTAGYWRFDTATPADASQLLFDELLARLPTDAVIGRALVVGGDAEAQAFRQAFGVEALCDIPPRVWLHGTPRRFGVEDGSLDLIVWVEGPAERDLSEGLAAAARTLRPGGRLLATDLVIAPSPAAWLVRATPSHAEALDGAGFKPIDLIDLTADGYEAMHRHSRDFFAAKRLLDHVDEVTHDRVLDALPGGRRAIAAHLLIHAEKRGASDEATP